MPLSFCRPHTIRAAMIVSVLTAGIAAPTPPPAAPVRQQAAPPGKDVDTLDAFKKRVHEYVLIHKQNETGLAKLPDNASPRQIDTFQRELGKRIIAARPNARKGDIFGADGTVLFRELLAPVFKGPDGARVLKEINDAEAHPVVPRVNGRYPDAVPLSTMPPPVLNVLPKLEEEIEFRFIGRHLILLDPHAHLVVDIVDNAIPA